MNECFILKYYHKKIFKSNYCQTKCCSLTNGRVLMCAPNYGITLNNSEVIEYFFYIEYVAFVQTK